MIKKITLENFRCFEKKQEISIKPITLIYGANSSGKSSIIKAIMALKQTLEFEEDLNEVLIGNGKFVDIGSFREFTNDKNKPFCIEQQFESKPKSKKRFLNRYFPTTEIKINNISIKYFYNCDKNNSIILSNIEIYGIKSPNEKTLLFSLKKEGKKIHSEYRLPYNDFEVVNLENKYKHFYKIDKVNSSYITKLLGISFLNNNFKEKFLVKINKFLDNPQKKDSSFRGLWKEDLDKNIEKAKKYKHFFELNEEKAKEFYQLEMEDYIKNTYSFVLKSILLNRMAPNKLKENLFDIGRFENELFQDDPFFNNELENELKEYFGSMFSIDIISIIENLNLEIKNYLEEIKYIGPLRKMPERYHIFSHSASSYVGKEGENTANILAKNPKIKNKINNKLLKFDVGYQVRTTKLKEDLYYLSLEDIKNDQKVQVAINDVGFGISQILPIVLQSFSSQGDSIFIEQPEIHLHPKLQAELGELFVHSYKENKNNFIIETHSETLMLRIQKLIREGVLSKDEVSVIYVDKKENGSECIHLELDEKGEFVKLWPNGFFEESFKELL